MSSSMEFAVAWHPADRPMARATAHLVAGRYPQAIGAFRATLGLDPTRLHARLGMADALAALGRRDEAVEELVHAAQRSMDGDEPHEAMSLYGKALALDPRRIDLHLDVAFVEDAMGRHEAAVRRIEGLADRYMNDGRTDEAAELLRFAATWGAPEPEPKPHSEHAIAPPRNPGLDMAPVHTAFISGHTVIARNPWLPPTPHPDSMPTTTPVTSDAIPTPVPAFVGPTAIPTHMPARIRSEAFRPRNAVRSDSVGRPEEPVRMPEANPAHDELEMEHEVTVARFVSTPIRIQADDDPMPACSSTPAALESDDETTVARPKVLRPTKIEPFEEDTTIKRPPAGPSPARGPAFHGRSQPSSRGSDLIGPSNQGKLRLPRTPRPTSMATRRSPVRSTPRNDGDPLTRVALNPVVERLRTRAGLSRAACPHGIRIRPTAPIATRPSRRVRVEAEEEATLRVRRPRGPTAPPVIEGSRRGDPESISCLKETLVCTQP